MGRRETYQFQGEDDRRLARRRIQPIWRGVGCLLLVLLTLAGYAFADWFLRANAANRWIFLPPELLNPAFARPWLSGGLIVKVVVAFLFLLLSFGVLSFLYAVAFPIRPGETDVPPLRRGRASRR